MSCLHFVALASLDRVGAAWTEARDHRAFADKSLTRPKEVRLSWDVPTVHQPFRSKIAILLVLGIPIQGDSLVTHVKV
jgi:hypothetical protein